MSWWPWLIGVSHFETGGGSGGDHTNICEMGQGSSRSNPVAHDDTDPPLPREPSFDDDGNEISPSEKEDESAFASSFEELSSNSLDEHSHSESDDIDHDSSKSDSSY